VEVEFKFKFCPDLFWEMAKKVPPRIREIIDKAMTIMEFLGILGIQVLKF
jgi:hypothetical protein